MNKRQLQEEYRKARAKYMRLQNEFSRCHKSSPRWSGLQEKIIEAEEKCVFLLRKKYPNETHDRLIDNER